MIDKLGTEKMLKLFTIKGRMDAVFNKNPTAAKT